ncbi:hypothetical protein QAD02_019866 [Eretmocerus hayati]|uniref:Uncharacterized protein n=1 Tax=Eretmocerus hayati TaxID=131215 RepID=A0ACC2PLA8_9HYME|nr:hypothetical protein QAD02_019866 [Eretmocerus hayati]
MNDMEAYGDGYMEPEEEWEREGLLDPAWEKQQKKILFIILDYIQSFDGPVICKLNPTALKILRRKLLSFLVVRAFHLVTVLSTTECMSSMVMMEYTVEIANEM